MRRNLIKELPTKMLLPLDCLRAGESAEVVDVNGETSWVCRMAELGLRTGSRVRMLQEGSTCLLQVDGCKLCVRSDGACQIMVQPVNNSSARS